MDGKEQNWLLIKRRDGDDGDGRPRRDVQADARDARRRASRTASDWAYEVKFDGYRALAYVRGGECRLVSRNDNDLTGALRRGREGDRQGGQEPERRRSTARSARLDPTGPDELLRAAAGQRPARLLRLRPARARRRAARRPAARPSARRGCGSCSTGAVTTVAFSEDFDDGDALFEAAQAAGARGDRREARRRRAYKPGKRTRDWLKIKTQNNEEFVVAGYTRGAGRRAETFGALVLARQRGRRAALRRQRRHRLRRRRDRQAAAAAASRCTATRRRSRSRRRCRASARATCSGSSRSSSRRCASASGRTTAICATPPTSASARTRARAR